MQDNIPDALVAAFERQYDAVWNDPQLRNERLAMRYGWAAAMEAKQCLHQIQEPAAAPVVLPIMPKGESAAAQLRAMATNYPPGHSWDKLDAKACIRGVLEIEALRTLLATGGQGQVVEQVPVLYVSKGQLDNHRNPEGPDSANAGRYLPTRITPAGKFTTPLFAAPQQADARDAVLLNFLVHEKAVVEVIEPSKNVYLSYSDGRIQAGSFPSPREAISAAIAAAKGEHQ